MEITSKQNTTIKHIASLKQKKYRDASGEYIVEGRKMITEAIQTGQQICGIYVLKGHSHCYDGFNVTEVSESVFGSISDEVAPQGELAVIKQAKKSMPENCERALLLDRIQDPGNMGTILRLAAAAGITDIFTLGCTDVYSPKCVRSSMSGIFRVNIYDADEQEVVSYLKGNKIALITADMGGENVFSFVPPKRFCLCFGNEGRGISDSLKGLADYTVAIPMQNGIESLNVGVAAGIASYALINNLIGR